MEGNKSVLITGSSTGIGRASALRLERRDFRYLPECGNQAMGMH